MSAATEYLQSYEHYFWRYEDQGKVIAVPDGRTIGYTDQVIDEVVFHLASQGLPRFGSLLLAIAATTAHGLETLEDIERIVEVRAKRNEEVDRGMWFLKLLTQVPAKIKQGNLRVLLLQAVFTSNHNGVGTKKSSQVLEELRAAPGIALRPAARRAEALTKLRMITSVINDFKTLAIIGRELKDVPTILERIANLPSMTQAVEASTIEPAGEAPQGSFVDHLLDHPDTFHVGALVAQLIGGLQISFHASQPSEQPLGGVADITNKGSFDKLLTSEYAFDDHVLLSRLANSEALYKHREVPPVDNTYTRVLLIDTTLKNWGTIRTISFATALAIARHPKNKDPYRIFLLGKSYREITVDTVMDVIDGLNTLDGTLDPGVGMEELFAREDLRASEIFFIGAVESAASPGMQRLSGEAGRCIDHWIHPDERGVVKVYKNPKRGKRFVQELTIPLEQAWSRSRAPGADSASSRPTSYPLLFPGMKMKATWTGERFTYGTTKYKGLMRLYAGGVDITHGWEFISEDVRPRDNLKAVITHDDLSVTVLFGTDIKEYTVVRYPEGERIKVALDRRILKAKNFYVENDHFAADLSQTTIYIDRQGQITESDTVPYRKRTDKVFRNKASNFYRNITRVHITLDHKLRIRKHDLLLESGLLRIHHRSNGPDVKLTATEKEPGVFAFADGSCVTHNANGILTLTSADPALPEVYLPVQLDTDLGIATADTFAGNTYYQKKARLAFIVNNPDDEASVANIITGYLDRANFRQAKEMVENGLIICPGEASLAGLTSVLIGHPFRVHSGEVQQQIITPTKFYQQYIKPFITHIVNHGTTAQTPR